MKDNSTPFNAKEYDAEVFNTIPYYREFFVETIDLVKSVSQAPQKWLDTGCGTGALIELAALGFIDTSFTLCDPSEEMIKLSKRRLSSIGNRTNFLTSIGTEELCSLDLPKQNVITAIQCHCYLKKEQKIIAIQNCFDLLEEGGVLVVFENIYPKCEKTKALAIERWKSFQIASGRDEKTVNDHAARFNKAYFPISIEEHFSIFKDAGFNCYDIFWYSHMQAGFFAVKE